MGLNKASRASQGKTEPVRAIKRWAEPSRDRIKLITARQGTWAKQDQEDKTERHGHIWHNLTMQNQGS